jgi:hypothetical protein
MEGSLVAYKVFTNGSVLQASEVNDNLMKQAVATFSNAAARTAAISSPVEGQLTYLEDVDRYHHWNGSAWVSPFGLSLIKTTNFTSQTSIAFDNVFTSEFQNYEIEASIIGTGGAGLQHRLRTGGVDHSTSSYQFNYIRAEATTVFGSTANSDDNWNLGTVRSGTHNYWKTSIANPAISGTVTSVLFHCQDRASVNVYDTGAGRNTSTDAFDGIRIFSGTSMTGTISIYGLRK